MHKNIVLIGAGIMSATLATLLRKLEPDWNVTILERLDRAGEESSNEWNNAGTGHEAFCELNYTPELEDGNIQLSKALEIFNQFQQSKQLWSYLVKEKHIGDPKSFIRTLPHISFVSGKHHVAFLKKRYDALSIYTSFHHMEYSNDAAVIEDWIPFMIEQRKDLNDIAATKVNRGTDVNFGELTRKMISSLENSPQVNVYYNKDVTDIKRNEDHTWEITAMDQTKQIILSYHADFVFIGAGGNSIPLLKKTKIRAGRSIAGFPISGEFLYCEDPELVKKHHAKVYGKEPAGTPPMTVPHLDRRYMNGKEVLLFGPFASIGPKFLKKGSNLDFFKAVRPDNILSLLFAGAKNIPLVNYSIKQILMSKEDKMNALRKFVPQAKSDDWKVITAGKRVQVIKDNEKNEKGIIHFGTEIVNSDDNTLSALLGESPGASTSVSIMLDVLESNFPLYFNEWKGKIKEMIPSYGEDLNYNGELLKEVNHLNTHFLRI